MYFPTSSDILLQSSHDSNCLYHDVLKCNLYSIRQFSCERRLLEKKLEVHLRGIGDIYFFMVKNRNKNYKNVSSGVFFIWHQNLHTLETKADFLCNGAWAEDFWITLTRIWEWIWLGVCISCYRMLWIWTLNRFRLWLCYGVNWQVSQKATKRAKVSLGRTNFDPSVSLVEWHVLPSRNRLVNY